MDTNTHTTTLTCVFFNSWKANVASKKWIEEPQKLFVHCPTKIGLKALQRIQMNMNVYEWHIVVVYSVCINARKIQDLYVRLLNRSINEYTSVCIYVCMYKRMLECFSLWGTIEIVQFIEILGVSGNKVSYISSHEWLKGDKVCAHKDFYTTLCALAHATNNGRFCSSREEDVP